MKTEKEIIRELSEYCEKYNIPIDHIVEVISDLKVIPMIRGKAFEFTLSDILKQILSPKIWKVTNPVVNAQLEVHDLDVNVIRKFDKKQARLECKLAGKNSFGINGGIATFKVKCMRSRTIGDNEVATRTANRYGINRKLVLLHRDNYRERDFDFVITSLGNAFWTTENKGYIFSGKLEQYKLLTKMFPNHFVNFRNFKTEAFNFLLFVRSSKIKVSEENNISCNRKDCKNKGTDRNCGFIPNYPVVNLNDVASGKGAWKPISSIESELNKFLA